ncbi:P-loop NTPase fold protein [Bacteroides sp. 51]|uniref:KAP family P-loop NTPase fold protein n=1 Tax=Bacteroides sp. 51 TaxID=2302938 RepID=UPI0013D45851|nr:P-loop NTPase fold protein [Bacteroides sp. 51]NDV80763.1 hypothetical protein [Bacteroides sp. 51]
MKIKHSDILINEEDPFLNCKLNRKACATILTNIVRTYSDGFVMAIDNEWGTGKTTFVKMWKQHLENNNFNTIYFNAWENDFDTNPLVAIMSELNCFTNSSNGSIFKSMIEKGAILSKNMLPALIKGIAKKYIDTEILVDAIENATKGATEILEEEIKEYSSKKQTIKDFKNELERFVKTVRGNKPIVFIIDELDRCRPNYAVEVLEQMKHFFSVDGIVFALSIDKIQLCHAIEGVYGSEHINANEYLRRFIDLEYSLPVPDTKDFCNYLYDYYEYDDFFKSNERIRVSELADDKERLLGMAETILRGTTLRQQEKIFGHARLVVNFFPKGHYLFPHLLFFLIYAKTLKSGFFERIASYTISLQELVNEFEDIFQDKVSPSCSVNFSYVEALLLYFYNNQRNNYKTNELYKVDDNGKLEVLVISRFSNSGNRPLNSYISKIINSGEFDDIKLNYLIEKINLVSLFVLS